MSATTPRTKSAQTETSPSDIVAEVVDKAENFLESNAAVGKIKEVGTEKLSDLRSIVSDRPVTAIAVSLGAGILLRSWFRGPTSTLLLMGGAAYLGARYLGQK